MLPYTSAFAKSRPSLTWVKSTAPHSVTLCLLQSWHPHSIPITEPREHCLLQCTTFHGHWCCSGLSDSTFTAPVQLPYQLASLLTEGQGSLFQLCFFHPVSDDSRSWVSLSHYLLYTAPVTLLSSTREVSELGEREFFQSCWFFSLLNVWESRTYWAGHVILQTFSCIRMSSWTFYNPWVYFISYF